MPRMTLFFLGFIASKYDDKSMMNVCMCKKKSRKKGKKIFDNKSVKKYFQMTCIWQEFIDAEILFFVKEFFGSIV